MSEETIQDLIIKAQEHIENADLTSAMEVGKQILAKDSDNLMGLEIMGYILLEMNCLEEAKFCFLKSIENGSTNSHVPYLYLGQLTEGEESEKYFLEAINMMTQNFAGSDEKKMLFRATKLDISNAYVSLCELYMTDLCDKENAEQKCNDYIKKAIESDQSNPATWQSIASLNLVKNDKEASKENIKKSLDLWLPEALKIVSNADNEECTNDILTTCELSAELRIKCTEILFELEMFTDARSVLETILIEDDEHFQAHYMMALTLEAILPTADQDKEEIMAMIEDHAEMAIGLANPELEQEAVEKMMNLLDKIGAGDNYEDPEGDENENMSTEEDSEDGEDME